MAASAEFNTIIYSSSVSGKKLTYILDDVITKDFPGSYVYTITNTVPSGVEITTDKNTNQSILNIPDNISSAILTIMVVNTKDAVSASTSTQIILAQPTFVDSSKGYSKNAEIAKKIDNTKLSWDSIISGASGSSGTSGTSGTFGTALIGGK